MLKKKGNSGIVFYRDPVSSVLPYIDSIEESTLSISTKNDVCSKLAGSVLVNTKAEAVAVLLRFAKIKGLESSIFTRLYDRVTPVLTSDKESGINLGTNADLLLAKYPKMIFLVKNK